MQAIAGSGRMLSRRACMIASRAISSVSLDVASGTAVSCSVAFTFALPLPPLNGALPSFSGGWYIWPFLANTSGSLSCVTLHVDVKWGCCLHLPQLFQYALHMALCFRLGSSSRILLSSLVLGGRIRRGLRLPGFLCLLSTMLSWRSPML